MKTIYIVKGEVTDLSSWDGWQSSSPVELGDTEWQFSDGPPGERNDSKDFLSLEEGFEFFERYDESDICFVWIGDSHSLGDDWKVQLRSDGSARFARGSEESFDLSPTHVNNLRQILR